jgi:hypothetical protein
MKLDPWHDSESKSLWKIVRRDNCTDVCPDAKGRGEIISADETSGECSIKIDGETVTLSLGSDGLRLVRRWR